MDILPSKDTCIRCGGKMRCVNAPNLGLLLHETLSALPKNKFREPLDVVVAVCEKCGKLEVFVESSCVDGLSIPLFDMPSCNVGYSYGYQSHPAWSSGDKTVS